MVVSENLKLRSAEATSSDVLAVMEAGTKVEILEVGKAETIDGITSNWVKVEVQYGAYDRDGWQIQAGTTGWCYGGYLEETNGLDVREFPVQEEPEIFVEQYSQDPELKLYYLYKTKHDTDLYEVPTLEERDYAKTIKKGTIVKYLRTDRDCTFDNIPSRWVFITTEIEKSYFLTAQDEDIKFFCAASDLELIEDQETPIEILELEEEERFEREKLEKEKIIRITILIGIPAVILLAILILIILLKKRKARIKSMSGKSNLEEVQ